MSSRPFLFTYPRSTIVLIIVPSTFNDVVYSLDHSMPLEKIVNSSIMFQQYYDPIKTEGANMSILAKRLVSVKKAVLDVKRMPYVQRHAATAPRANQTP